MTDRLMKEIKVTLVGVTPLLMHSAKMMLEDKDKVVRSKVKGKAVDYNAQAEKYTYRSKNKDLYVPANAIKGAMVNASAGKKSGKFFMKPIIAGSVYIRPFEVSLGTKVIEEVDIRTVVNKNMRSARIIVARPRFNNWKIDFTIVYDSVRVGTGVIKEILEEAGWRIGLLSFSPRNYGEFGQFKIEKFDVKGDKNGKNKGK